ncbi:MAG: restriction endonuclease subunit S [Acidobacteriota bacterium]|nr:restriction endonuclease subunit S [Acidobacteriota bacterium]
MSFPRYERYKNSGVEWLGEVPEHWDVVPLKRSFTIVGGSTPSSEVETYWGGGDVWVTPADLSKITDRYISKSERTITKQGLESCSSSLVPAGSIVISTRAPIGSLAIAGVELCTNQGCKSLVPMPGSVSNCYAYLLNILTEELRIRGKGTTFLELSADALGSVEIPRPPTEEQQSIGKFLDQETAKIDALIEEQRRLIELLKEKRQAVISHAVTKGLNSNSPLTDSGVEWLGTTPEHWRRLRIGAIFREVNESGCDGLPILSVSIHYGVSDKQLDDWSARHFLNQLL